MSSLNFMVYVLLWMMRRKRYLFTERDFRNYLSCSEAIENLVSDGALYSTIDDEVSLPHAVFFSIIRARKPSADPSNLIFLFRLTACQSHLIEGTQTSRSAALGSRSNVSPTSFFRDKTHSWRYSPGKGNRLCLL